MSKRSEHTFQFSAARVAQAAKDEAEYHGDRVDHWNERAEKALVQVKATASIEVQEHQVTGGKRVSLGIKYGDVAAWDEYVLASSKAQGHRESADRFTTDAQVYGSQDGGRVYELDTDDVHHFRLGGQERED